MSYQDYSLMDSGIPYGFEQTQIPYIKKGQSFLFEGNEGVFKATKDAYEEEGLWVIEAEDIDFNPQIVRYRKNDLAYAPKIFVEKET